jgi:hypothetical protein
LQKGQGLLFSRKIPNLPSHPAASCGVRIFYVSFKAGLRLLGILYDFHVSGRFQGPFLNLFEGANVWRTTSGYQFYSVFFASYLNVTALAKKGIVLVPEMKYNV